MVFIALSKGELSEDVENYLSKLGVRVKVSGKPLLTQTAGQTTYRIINARDVPRFVGSKSPSYDFGITGFDYWLDEALSPERTADCLPLRALDFGKGDLVLYGKPNRVMRKPKIVMPKDMENVGTKFMDDLFGDYWVPFPVNGATEGYVSAGEADLGVDLMSCKNTDPRYIGTIKRNGLVVLKNLLSTQAVLIGKYNYEFNDFLRAIKT